MNSFWQAAGFKKLGFPALPFKKLFIAAFFINLAALTTALLSQIFLPPQIPLFYGQAEAENIIAPTLALIIPTIVSLVFLAINLLFSFAIKDDFLKKIMTVSGFAASLFALITIIKIVFLVGSF